LLDYRKKKIDKERKERSKEKKERLYSTATYTHIPLSEYYKITIFVDIVSL